MTDDFVAVIKEIITVSVPLASYRAGTIKRRRRTRTEIEQLDRQILDVLAEDHPQSVRHVFYRMTNPRLAEPVEKSDKGYRHVQDRVVKLRRSGVLPYGCYAFRAGCGIGTPTFNHRTTVPLYHRAKFRFETRCGAEGGCPTTASGFNPGNRALFSAANVSVRVDDWTLPAVTPHSGVLWRTGWHRGHEEAWTSYTDNVGIMVTRMTVDGEQRDVQD